jgi:hypothetical protein
VRMQERRERGNEVGDGRGRGSGSWGELIAAMRKRGTCPDEDVHRDGDGGWVGVISESWDFLERIFVADRVFPPNQIPSDAVL